MRIAAGDWYLEHSYKILLSGRTLMHITGCVYVCTMSIRGRPFGFCVNVSCCSAVHTDMIDANLPRVQCRRRDFLPGLRLHPINQLAEVPG